MFVIRAFGGEVAYDGEGSLYKEADEAITHQVSSGSTAGKLVAMICDGLMDTGDGHSSQPMPPGTPQRATITMPRLCPVMLPQSG